MKKDKPLVLTVALGLLSLFLATNTGFRSAGSFGLSSMKEETRLRNEPQVGELAPDIALPNPDGKIIKLSSLRGKVVLLDFWASWCGPCRYENPTTVAAYEKYKDQGFTVYSVSLDRSKAKWVHAIKADQLTWENHVSDLQFTNSAVAAQYGIESIPATFLLDANGKIIARDLRGKNLDKALNKALNIK
jgi:peroxiredoxin